VQDLNGTSVCVQAGTTTELNLADFSRRHNVAFVTAVFDTAEQAFAAYDSGRCRIITSDISQLLAHKTVLTRPNDHAVLNVVMSKEPLGPVVRQDDRQWFDIIKWVAFGLIEAEEQGVASDNLQQLSTSTAPAIRHLLGREGDLGSMLGLRNDFMVSVIGQVGNYGEIFDRHLRPLDLIRGMNALWTAGGLLYAPPFR
jgi:general L-amino acid transport system substrate-binding protein